MSADAFAAAIERMRLGFAALARHIPAVLADPRGYPREAMLLAIIAVLAILFVLFAFFAILDGVRERIRRRALGLRVRRASAWTRTVFVAGAIVLAVFAVAVSPMIPATGDACGSCHEVAAARDSWASSAHASQSCYACHAGGTISGALSASSAGLVRTVFGPDAVPHAGVDSSACLRCHRDVESGVITADVKMRHSDVIAAGMSCGECHRSVGHSPDVTGEMERSTMSVCLTCHDGELAPTDCESCHKESPLDTSGTQLTPGGTPLEVTCRGCHSQELQRRCIACHGLEMPHPEGFLRSHAGLSQDSPAVCVRCHGGASAGEGCGCHDDQNVHGTYSVWFPRHGTTALAGGPVGCNCHKQVFCALCHDSDPFAGSR